MTANNIKKYYDKVDRFNLCDQHLTEGGSGYMDPDNQGDWVQWKDYAAALDEIERLREALQEGVDLIKGEAVGMEWKRGCRVFIGHARAALKKGSTP